MLDDQVPILNSDALSDILIMSISLERNSTIPKNTNIVELDAKAEVNIDQKQYSLTFMASGPCKTLTKTRIRQQYFVKVKDQTGAEVVLPSAKLKGQKVMLTINKVKYIQDTYKAGEGEVRKEVAVDAEVSPKAIEWVF